MLSRNRNPLLDLSYLPDLAEMVIVKNQIETAFVYSLFNSSITLI